MTSSQINCLSLLMIRQDSVTNCQEHGQPLIYVSRRTPTDRLDYRCKLCITRGDFADISNLADKKALLRDLFSQYDRSFPHAWLNDSMHQMYYQHIDELVNVLAKQFKCISISTEGINRYIYDLRFMETFDQKLHDIREICLDNHTAEAHMIQLWGRILPSLKCAEYWVKQALLQAKEEAPQQLVARNWCQRRATGGAKCNEIITMIEQHQLASQFDYNELLVANQNLRAQSDYLRSRAQAKDNQALRLEEELRLRIKSLMNSQSTVKSLSREKDEFRRVIVALVEEKNATEDSSKQLRLVLDACQRQICGRNNELRQMNQKRVEAQQQLEQNRQIQLEMEAEIVRLKLTIQSYHQVNLPSTSMNSNVGQRAPCHQQQVSTVYQKARRTYCNQSPMATKKIQQGDPELDVSADRQLTGSPTKLRVQNQPPTVTIQLRKQASLPLSHRQSQLSSPRKDIGQEKYTEPPKDQQVAPPNNIQHRIAQREISTASRTIVEINRGSPVPTSKKIKIKQVKTEQRSFGRDHQDKVNVLSQNGEVQTPKKDDNPILKMEQWKKLISQKKLRNSSSIVSGNNVPIVSPNQIVQPGWSFISLPSHFSIPDINFQDSKIVEGELTKKILVDFLTGEGVQHVSQELLCEYSKGGPIIDVVKLFGVQDILILVKSTKGEVLGLYSRVPLIEITDDFKDIFLFRLEGQFLFGLQSFRLQVKMNNFKLVANFIDLQDRVHELQISYNENKAQKLEIIRKSTQTRLGKIISFEALEVYRLTRDE